RPSVLWDARVIADTLQHATLAHRGAGNPFVVERGALVEPRDQFRVFRRTKDEPLGLIRVYGEVPLIRRLLDLVARLVDPRPFACDRLFTSESSPHHRKRVSAGREAVGGRPEGIPGQEQ